MQQRLAIIDNEDSFTYNLVQIISESELCEYSIFTSNSINENELAEFDKILISPGSGIPSERSILNKVLDKYHNCKPILGICLGHQSIGEYFGAKLINLPRVFHGYKEIVEILEPKSLIFNKIPQCINVGLYHSWAIDGNNFPNCLKIEAKSKNGIIMAISHKAYCVYGIQFHPESYMTEFGRDILRNWLKISH